MVSLTMERAKHFGESRSLALARMLHMLTLGRYSPSEIMHYAPHLKNNLRRIPVPVSKQASLTRLRRFNNPAQSDLTEDKHVFYRHCEAHDIPAPRHLFSTQSDDARYEAVKTEAGALYRLLPDHFIVKDRHGAYGGGFEAYDKTEEGFLSSKGLAFSEQELVKVFDDPDSGPLIIQERVYDHPDLATLSGSGALQTVRVITYRDSRGFITPLYFHGKLINPGNIIDNFSGGATGNLLSFGNLATGKLEGAVRGHPSGMGLETVTVHPASGRAIAGFKLPLWEETLDAAINAHHAFEDFKAIGWDIAVTPTGPMIIEGNIWFDPPLFAPHIMANEDWSLLFGIGFRMHKGYTPSS